MSDVSMALVVSFDNRQPQWGSKLNCITSAFLCSGSSHKFDNITDYNKQQDARSTYLEWETDFCGSFWLEQKQEILTDIYTSWETTLVFSTLKIAAKSPSTSKMDLKIPITVPHLVTNLHKPCIILTLHMDCNYI